MALNIQVRGDPSQARSSAPCAVERGAYRLRATWRAQHPARTVCLHTNPTPIDRAPRFGSASLRCSSERRDRMRSRLPASSRISPTRRANRLCVPRRCTHGSSAYLRRLLSVHTCRSSLPVASAKLTQSDVSRQCLTTLNKEGLKRSWRRASRAAGATVRETHCRLQVRESKCWYSDARPRRLCTARSTLWIWSHAGSRSCR